MSRAPVVDARGARCPRPVIEVARAAADLPPGTVVVLLADDPAAETDVPAWCRMRGHRLRSVDVLDAAEGGGQRYGIEVG